MAAAIAMLLLGTGPKPKKMLAHSTLRKRTMKNNYLKTRITVCSLAACSGAFAADGLTLNVGGDYTSGTYGGTDRTTITSIPLSAKYRTGPVTFRASVSWLSVTGTGAVIPSGLGGIGHEGGSGASGGGGGGSVGVFGCAADNRRGARKPEDNGPCATTSAGAAAVATTRSTEQGFGDIVAAAVFHAIDTKGLLVDITGKIKFATASDTKGLGSGKNDYALQVEADKAFGRAYINGGIGHKWLGDPVGISLRNVWYGSIGGGFKPTADTTVGMSYDYGQAARSGGTAGQEVSLYASQRLTKNIKLNGSVFQGLSNGSPDWGVGIGLAYNF